MELTRLKKKLSTAMRGHKLLKDKRDELMRQFLDMVRQNKALREKVEVGIHAANKNFLLARAATDAQVLDVALMAPKQEVFLEASERNVMSVEIPVFEYKTRTRSEERRVGKDAICDWSSDVCSSDLCSFDGAEAGGFSGGL